MDARRSVIPALGAVLALATLVMMWPFAAWILLAIWAAALVRPGHTWLARKLGRRPRLAAFLLTFGLVAIAAPVIVVLVSLADDAIALVQRALATDRAKDLLHSLSDGGGTTRGIALVGNVVSTAASAVIGLGIAIVGLYTLLVDGGRWYAWLEKHAPLPAPAFRRLAGAVVETGRGLVFGFLGAGLVQALIATILYLSLGLPHALALGLLTFAASIIPGVGTMIVWVPIVVGLAASGHDTSAIILGVGGLCGISSIDNIVKPYLARRGKLQLPATVVALAMFAGIATLGAAGVVIGPLIVRLAKEALALWREQRDAT